LVHFVSKLSKFSRPQPKFQGFATTGTSSLMKLQLSDT